MLTRRFLQSLSCAAIVLATSVAAATEGRLILVGGQVVDGDIEEVVSGDYILIRMPDGDLKAYPWSAIESYQYAGTTVYQPAPPPPTIVYVPKTTPYAPPPPPPPRPLFQPAWVIGVRVGSMAASGNVYGNDYNDYYDHYRDVPRTDGPKLRMGDIASWGWMVQGDLGYHFSPSWTFYGFWEHGELDHGDLNRSWGHTNAVGAGINANSAPYGDIGLYFDLGASYRWMEFTNATPQPNLTVSTERTTAEGFDYFRAAIGASINLGPRFRLDPHVYTSTGYFTRFNGSGCTGCGFEGRATEYGLHWLSGVAVTGRWDLAIH